MAKESPRNPPETPRDPDGDPGSKNPASPAMAAGGLEIPRYFTPDGKHPFDHVEWVRRDTVIEDEQGNELVLAYLNAGEFFGEIGLFGENTQRSAVVRAKIASDIAQISYERLKATPTLFPDLLMIIAEQLAHRLRRMDQKIGDLAFLDVAGRVARALADLTKEPNAMTHPDGMLVRVTRLELGDIVGASREMVGRVLVVLEEQGLISVDGKSVVVFGKREPMAPRTRAVALTAFASR